MIIIYISMCVCVCVCKSVAVSDSIMEHAYPIWVPHHFNFYVIGRDEYIGVHRHMYVCYCILVFKYFLAVKLLFFIGFLRFFLIGKERTLLMKKHIQSTINYINKEESLELD